MACGVHLGILLICLVQAEHVRCSWASQAQSSQRQNSNGYVGFSQQDSGLSRFGGSYPQNQLRQASVSPHSAQKSSPNSQTAASSGYSQGHSRSSYSQSLSQPAQSGLSSVRFVQSSSVSKPNWRPAKLKQVNEPKKQSFGLSTSIASGSSVSKYDKKKNDLPDVSKNTWPVKQGTQSVSKYPYSSSASLQTASSTSSKLASHWSAAMKAPSAAGTSAYYGQGGYASAVKTSSLFSPRAPSSQKNSDTQMQTSATAPARRVPLHRSSKQSKLSSFSSSPKTFRTEAAKPNQSKLFSVAGGNAQGSYKSTSSFQPRSPQMPTSQRFRSTEQNPSSTSSLQNPAQGAHNQPASGSGGTPRYAPTRTHSIPERFGGFAIRRLKDPDDQKEAGIRHPQQTYTAPSAQSGSYQPQVQNIRKPQQTYTAPSVQTASYQPQVQNIRKPQQTYTAPSVQIVSYKPQVQSIRKPQQTYTAPSAQILSYKPQQTYTASSAQSVSYKPQVQNTRKPQQAYTAPSEQTASYQPQVQNIRKPQQTYPAPSAQTVLHTPQVQSVHQESKWKRVRPRWGQ